MAKEDFFCSDGNKPKTNQFSSSASSWQSVAMDIQCGCMFEDESGDVEARANQRRTIQSNFFFPEVLLWSPWTYIYFPQVRWGLHTEDYFSVWEMAERATEIRGWTDFRSHLLFLAISPVPIPLLYRPSHQNKIIICTAEALPFYWRLSDACVIMSDLGFDRLTRERLVLQGESMTLGHIPINRLPQFFLLMLPALWQIRCFIKKKHEGRGWVVWGWRDEGWRWQHGIMLKITHSVDSNKTFEHDV